MLSDCEIIANDNMGPDRKQLDIVKVFCIVYS